MSIDLVKAFALSNSAPMKGDGLSGGGEFPSVLKSTLGTEESSRAPSNRKTEKWTESKTQTSTAVAKTRKASSDSTSDAASKAVAESGAAGASAAAYAERARETLAADDDEALEGRRTDLDSETGRGGNGAPDIESGEGDPEISRELGDQLLAVARGEAGSESSPGAAEAQATASEEGVELQRDSAAGAAGLEGGREVQTDQRAATPDTTLEASGERGADSEERAGSDSDRPPQEESARSSDASQFERAAEGSQSSEIDPTLRQAIANQQAVERAPDSVSIDGASAIASPVAGAATEVTTTAAPGTPTPPVASDAISVQTEWLLSRGGGTARLTLHPAQLGEIAIRVTLRGGVVDVVMVAQEAAARGIAEEQSDRLSQAFASRDLRMENFEVRRGDANDLADATGEQFAGSGRGDGGQSSEDDASRESANAGASGDERAQPLAAMPRIMTAAPESGVDLRI